MYKSPTELALMQKANDIAIVAYVAHDSMTEGMSQGEFAGICSAAFRSVLRVEYSSASGSTPRFRTAAARRRR